MLKQIKVTEKENQITTNWSGGKTTEITIFPENTSYEQRNFLFRLSSATVETEESDFTKLEDTNRILIVLDGSLTLIHPNRYEKKLNYLEQDTFKGNWDTKSIGKARDFNLMVRKDCEFKMDVVELNKCETKEINFENKYNSTNHYLLFQHKGSSEINIGEQQIDLKEEDLVHIIYDNEDSKIIIQNSESNNNKVIISSVKY